VYLVLPSSTGEPGSRLVAFGQVSLRPGKSRQVSLTVRADSAQHPLSYLDTASHGWLTAAGTYTVQVATSAQTPVLTATFGE
jgi:beta-glucosidase